MGQDERNVREMMDRPKIDRRVMKTRRALQHAFMGLILEKGYDAVSIQDICDAADVGRSTFYSHYTGKDDLKRAGLNHLRTAVDAARLAEGNKDMPLGFITALFDHAQGHGRLYQALVGTSGGVVALDTVRNILSEAITLDPWFRARVATNDRAFISELILGAVMAGLLHWLDGGARGDPSNLAERVRNFAVRGVEGAP